MFFIGLLQAPQGILNNAFYISLSIVPHFTIIESSFLCLSCKPLEGKGHFLISIFSTTQRMVDIQ